MYKLLDSEILKELHPNAIEFAKQFLFGCSTNVDDIDIDINKLLDTSECALYLFYCAYCRNLSMLSTTKIIHDDRVPFVCIFCGETDPYKKFESCLLAVNRIRDILKDMENVNRASEIDHDLERILLEYCIIKMTTGFEIFLKKHISR